MRISVIADYTVHDVLGLQQCSVWFEFERDKEYDDEYGDSSDSEEYEVGYFDDARLYDDGYWHQLKIDWQ